MEKNEEKKVLVYYCKCGKSITTAGCPEFINSDRASKKEFKDAEKWGRKVETLTLSEYKKIPFLCHGVTDCPDNLTSKTTTDGK